MLPPFFANLNWSSSHRRFPTDAICHSSLAGNCRQFDLASVIS
jgi:hypothetical protein